jgi:aldose 1-epimerase
MTTSERSIELPSGEQFPLTWADQQAVVVEVGGALRSYQKAGVDLVEGYTENDWCTGGRGQTLAPWPNRLRDGKYTFAGQSNQLPLTEPEKHNAIHGLVRWENWKLVERKPDQVTLAYVLHPIPGYRFSLRIENHYRLSERGLSVETVAQNVGPSACPYGSGAHPYLTVGQKLDECQVRAPGRVRLPTDERGIPSGRESVEGSDYDFRERRSLRNLKVDYAFTDLVRDANGLAWVELSDADGHRAVSLWLDGQYPYLQLFTGDTLEPRFLRTGLGVEPITCPANAFQSQEGLTVLHPGQVYRSKWGVMAGALPNHG